MIRYLSRTDIARRLGVHRGTASTFDLPEADAAIGDREGWLPETVDKWNARRPGSGRWGPRKPK